MPCCGPAKESEADAAKKAQGVDTTNEAGPLAGAGNRCTDVLCLLCIVACWLGLSILGLVVTGVPGFEVKTLPPGDPRRLLYGVDYLGNLCSVAEHTTYHADGSYRTYDVSHRPKSYYLPSGAVVCIKTCPSADDARRFICDYDAMNDLDRSLAQGNTHAYWSAGLAYVLEARCNFQWATTEVLSYCAFDDVPDIGGALAASLPMDAPSPRPTLEQRPETFQPSARPTPAPTTSRPTPVATGAPSFNASVPCTQALDRAYCDSLVNGSRAYCYDWFCPTCALPGACDFACGFCESSPPTPVPEVPQRDGTSNAVYEEIASDVFATKDYILLFGFLVAAAFGFAYLVLLQIPFLLFAMVWVLLTGVLLLLVAAAAFSAVTARDYASEDPPAHSERELQVMQAVAALLVGASLLYACVLVALRKRITLAIGILKEAARALTTMPALALLPILQCAGLVFFFAVWVVYVAYLASAGELGTAYVEYNGAQVSYKEFEYSRDQQWAALYLCFAWFWTSEFIFALGQLVVAGAVVQWYFTRDKATAALLSPLSLLSLVAKIARRHAGTAAFGALLIAVCKTLQVVVQYVKNCTPAKGNRLAKLVLDCITLCLVAVEKCIRFLNKHAYIQTVLHGVGFCTAGFRAFALIAANGGRVAAVACVAKLVLFFGKLCVALATTFCFYVYVLMDLRDELHGVVAPAAVCFAVAYFTADAFNNVFEMCIWTILQCFVVDEAQFKERPFASGALSGCIKKTAAARPGRGCCGRAVRGEGPLWDKFCEFDRDGSGLLEANELKGLLATCTGAAPSEREIAKMMASVDANADGVVDFGEFREIHRKALDGSLEFQNLADAMTSFDAVVASMDDDDDDSDEAEPAA